MLERWSLANFKSVYDAQDFQLKRLTVLAGANSSGKSTLIQSILMLAQTITNPTPTRALVLNGQIARLGSFRDVASEGQANQPIRLCFTYSLSDALSRSRSHDFYLSELGVRSIQCELAFAPSQHGTDELQQLHPDLVECKLTEVMTGSDKPFAVTIKQSRVSVQERAQSLQISLDALTPKLKDSLRYDVEMTHALPPASRYFAEPPSGATNVGVGLTHFLPSQLSIRYDATRATAERTVRSLTGSSDYHFPRSVEQDAFASDTLLNRIVQIAREATASEKLLGQVIRRLESLVAAPSIDAVVEFNHRYRSAKLRAAYEENFDELVRLSQGALAARLVVDFVPLVPEAIQALNYFFRERFRYLGPLRDEPKAVYPLEGSVDPSHVGLKGEFTAAVLDLHRAQLVRYVKPDDFEREGMTAPVTQGPLERAIVEWLHYLGVVERFKTFDRGVFGHELRVAINERDGLYNLVHVGVGVSQVLPILVMSLLSEPGSLLLFEQPELHLHPRVQGRLADFLLSLAVSERQCIVETHSEYMINRLRYRIAADSADAVRAALALYFVEKSANKSAYRLIEVNEYGAIPDWPEGFFDQSPAEAERILTAAMEKRRRLKQL
jgi:predicted ATPase